MTGAVNVKPTTPGTPYHWIITVQTGQGLMQTLSNTIHHEGPAPQWPGPADLRALALSAGRRLNADYLTPDGHAIADQLAALTAAVLHLADTVTRAHDRP